MAAAPPTPPTARVPAACRIADGVGEIAPGPDGRPEARVGTSRLGMPKKAPALPPPGAYRLYWLESARGGPGPLLLSAEPLDRQEAEAPTDFVPPDGPLPFEALGLTPGDLAANRAGLLTVRQRRPLIAGFCLRVTLWGVGAVAWTGLFLVPSVEAVGTLIASGPTGSWFATLAKLLFCLAFSAFFCGMGAAGVWVGVAEGRISDLWHALRSPAPVRRTVDRVSVRGDGTQWQLSTARLNFMVASTVAQTFLTPGRYALYHLPDLGILLSAEPGEPVELTEPAKLTELTEGDSPAPEGPVPIPRSKP